MCKSAFIIAATLVLSVAAVQQAPDIELQNGVFRVSGWKAPQSEPYGGWGTVFLVYAGAGKVPPLLGSWNVESGTLVFHPHYPVTAGVHYHAVFRAPSGAMITRDFDGPARDTNPVARVEQVYPTAEILPSNLLRIYILFSAPMSRGEAAAHLHVEDDKGKVLPDELLPGQELWDPSFRRLTMTFDPGRIKRGLTSNQNIGPPIVEGKHYRLVLDRDWPDARGVPMTEGFTRTFVGGPADRIPPDPKTWHIVTPKAGTSDVLAVTFPKPMNYALLQRMIQVVTSHGNVAGIVSTAQQEAQWRFAPQGVWKAGQYQLVVDTAIEDLAGNRIGQPFDIDVFEHVTQHIETRTISLPFDVH